MDNDTLAPYNEVKTLIEDAVNKALIKIPSRERKLKILEILPQV